MTLGPATNPQPQDDPQERFMEHLEPRINEIQENFREHMSEERIQGHMWNWPVKDRERAIAEIAEAIAVKEHLNWD